MVLFARWPVVALLFVWFGNQVRSDASDHRYNVGDSVPFYANKVGPFINPSETYPYFDLPFCSPDADTLMQKKLNFGEMLNGDRLVSGPYKLEFLINKDSQVACRKTLSKEQVSLFRSAIARDYYVQMYYDDLPVWAFFGMIKKQDTVNGTMGKYFLFNHLNFEVMYNKDRVIEIYLLTDSNSLAELTEDREVDIEFLYNVKWKETTIPFDTRMEKYRYISVLPHLMTIHHHSIINSSVTVFILIGCLLIFYVRKLGKDISRYAQDEELASLAGNQEERGWKYIHGDVFRFPANKSLFAAAVGCGAQLLTLVLIMIILGVMDVFHPYDRGVLLNVFVIVYAITFAVAGYKSISFYYQLEGTNWIRNLLLTGVLSCGPLSLTFCFLQTIAGIYRVTAALPVTGIFLIALLWTFVAVPLCLLGGIAGRNIKYEFQAPCRTTECPREVPKLKWYGGILPQMALAGILPFSVIYVELYYIFSSVWGYKIYTIYGVLFIVFMLLLIVTALVSVTLTYYQLAAENHYWWWRSFFCGGSTGFFVYAYSFYYYFLRSNMSGLLQTSFFFGYMACVSYGVFLMLGTVGFHASLLFVRYLYGSIKCE